MSTAWVTLATNDNYCLGALVLAHSLRRVNTVHQLAVLVTSGVTPSMRQQLESVFNLVKNVDVLDSGDEANLVLMARPDLGVTFTKLHCWNLTQFTKCVFLDADVLVVQNCDELFEREELSASPDVGWPDCFNSGVFVFVPSKDTYKSLVNCALAQGSFDGGDQGLLNTYFSDWSTKDIKKHLPFIYNMVSTATYSYLPAFKLFGSQVKIVHFIGANKPWHQNKGGAASTLTGFLDLWWNTFNSHVVQSLRTDMAGLAGAIAGGDVTAIEEGWRQNWEQGVIDYMGRDCFDNIWKKISETVGSAKTSPPVPAPSDKKIDEKLPQTPVVPLTASADTIKKSDSKGEVPQKAQDIIPPPELVKPVSEASKIEIVGNIEALKDAATLPVTPQTEASAKVEPPKEVAAPPVPSQVEAGGKVEPPKGMTPPTTPQVEASSKVEPPKDITPPATPQVEASAKVEPSKDVPSPPIQSQTEDSAKVVLPKDGAVPPVTSQTDASVKIETPKDVTSPVVTPQTDASAKVEPPKDVTSPVVTPQTDASAKVEPPKDVTSPVVTSQTDASAKVEPPKETPLTPQTETSTKVEPPKDVVTSPVTPQTDASPKVESSSESAPPVPTQTEPTSKLELSKDVVLPITPQTQVGGKKEESIEVVPPPVTKPLETSASPTTLTKESVATEKPPESVPAPELSSKKDEAGVKQGTVAESVGTKPEAPPTPAIPPEGKSLQPSDSLPKKETSASESEPQKKPEESKPIAAQEGKAKIESTSQITPVQSATEVAKPLEPLPEVKKVDIPTADSKEKATSKEEPKTPKTPEAQVPKTPVDSQKKSDQTPTQTEAKTESVPAAQAAPAVPSEQQLKETSTLPQTTPPTAVPEASEKPGTQAKGSSENKKSSQGASAGEGGSQATSAPVPPKRKGNKDQKGPNGGKQSKSKK